MALAVDRTTLDAGTERWRLRDGNDVLDFAGVVRRWVADAGFRSFWHAGIRAVPFEAHAWECPPVTAEDFSRPFECVFVQSPALARMASEPEAFADHFRSGCEAVTFRNLGGDAVLVAPCPGAGEFTHLARFVATASPAQSDAFWRAVGTAMQARLDDRPVWLSTAGLGVGWLHVRLDNRPKYYRHAPYTVVQSGNAP
jgi:hypothetical protein